MRIAVINDNTRKLKIWLDFLGGDVTSFSHPSLFLYHHNNTKKYDLIILDRMFHQRDVLKDDTIKCLRSTCPDSYIVLSSALHCEGEKIEAVDFVLDQWPIDRQRLELKLGMFKCKEI